jgi:hypothetical protein
MFPKCSARLGYGLILGPLFGERPERCLLHTAFPYTFDAFRQKTVVAELGDSGLSRAMLLRSSSLYVRLCFR